MSVYECPEWDRDDNWIGRRRGSWVRRWGESLLSSGERAVGEGRLNKLDVARGVNATGVGFQAQVSTLCQGVTNK